MKKIIFKFLFLIFIFTFVNNANADDQTEITTDGGIEVYQKDKYYELIKNVNIKSKDFSLKAHNVKAYYNKDFYDLVKIIATGNAKMNTSDGAIILGNKIIYETTEQKFHIIGNGNFSNSELTVIGDDIKGNFIKINEKSYVENVEAKDADHVYIENKEMKSYSKSAIYSKEKDIIELFDSVKIIKNREITTGDYANINMVTKNYSIITNNNPIIINGYQIKSNDNKAKLFISTTD